MPDIWTKHPDIVKALLEESGFQCGVEPRVLKPRDPEWTCILDGEKISGDIYIHPVSELTSGKVEMGAGHGWEWLLIFTGLLAVLGLIRKIAHVRSRR